MTVLHAPSRVMIKRYQRVGAWTVDGTVATSRASAGGEVATSTAVTARTSVPNANSAMAEPRMHRVAVSVPSAGRMTRQLMNPRDRKSVV